MSERRCRWFTSNGRLCDVPCGNSTLCERHNRVEAVREAGAALRAATEAVAKARDAVVETAKAWRARLDAGDNWVDTERLGLSGALDALSDAERAESEARAKLEALRG